MKHGVIVALGGMTVVTLWISITAGMHLGWWYAVPGAAVTGIVGYLTYDVWRDK